LTRKKKSNPPSAVNEKINPAEMKAGDRVIKHKGKKEKNSSCKKRANSEKKKTRIEGKKITDAKGSQTRLIPTPAYMKREMSRKRLGGKKL